jgi:uncharacterized damage-inducible protein DinB
MSDVTMFERLFQWDAWANERVIGALRGCDATKPGVRKAIDRLAHMLCAQEIWLSRLGAGEWETGRALFPEGADLKKVERDAKVLAARWAQLCRVVDEGALDEVIAYTSTEGAAYETSRREIMLHVTHHGAYHRGQIAVDLKREGVVASATDYVFFARRDVV